MEPKHASSCGVPGERRPAVDGRDAGGVVSGEAEQLPGGSGGRRTIGVAGLDGDADDVTSSLDDNGECSAWLRERETAVRRPTAAPVAASASALGKGSSYTVADSMQPPQGHHCRRVCPRIAHQSARFATVAVEVCEPTVVLFRLAFTTVVFSERSYSYNCNWLHQDGEACVW